MSLAIRAMLALPLEEIMERIDIIPIDDTIAHALLLRISPYPDIIDKYHKMGWLQYIDDLRFLYRNIGMPIIVDGEAFYWDVTDRYILLVNGTDIIYKELDSLDDVFATIIATIIGYSSDANLEPLRNVAFVNGEQWAMDEYPILDAMVKEKKTSIDELLKILESNQIIDNTDLRESRFHVLATVPYSMEGYWKGFLINGSIITIGWFESIDGDEESYTPFCFKYQGANVARFLAMVAYNGPTSWGEKLNEGIERKSLSVEEIIKQL